MAARALNECLPFTSQTQAKRNVVAAIETVAKRLGNTKAICRKCYVHPEIVNAYMDGSLAELLRRQASRELTRSGRRLPKEELAVLACLHARLKVDGQRASPAKTVGACS